MDFVNEKHVSLFERSQQAGKVSGPVQNRPRGNLHVNPHFVGYNMRKGGFPEPRRTMEKGVVQGFPAHLRGLYIDVQIIYYFPLAREIHEFLRADNSVQFLIFAVRSIVRVEIGHGWLQFLQIQI